MNPDGLRLLYLDSYTVTDPSNGAPSSDAIGARIREQCYRDIEEARIDLLDGLSLRRAKHA